MMGGVAARGCLVAARRDAALEHTGMQAVRRGWTAGHLHVGHPQWSPPCSPPQPGPFSEHSVYTWAAGDLRELPGVPLRGEGSCGGVGAPRDSAGSGATEEGLTSRPKGISALKLLSALGERCQ